MISAFKILAPKSFISFSDSNCTAFGSLDLETLPSSVPLLLLESSLSLLLDSAQIVIEWI